MIITYTKEDYRIRLQSERDEDSKIIATVAFTMCSSNLIYYLGQKGDRVWLEFSLLQEKNK